MRIVPSYEYFDWLIEKTGKRSRRYSQLLDHLFYTEFTYILEMDENRLVDGLDLRYRFMTENDCQIENDYLYAPCSVLEVMVALSIRCEDQFMSDDYYGDRTETWFWDMVASLGLGGMTDGRYDGAYVDDVLTDFLERNYEYDGKGGLFTIRKPKQDMRSVEIWYQMNAYLIEYTSKYQ